MSRTINLYRIMVVLLPLLSISCTHNDGDIGRWFGTWKLEEIRLPSGGADSNYEGNIIWKFQNSVVLMQTVGDYHSVADRWGKWHEEEGVIVIDTDMEQGDSGPSYSFPPEMHLPAKGTVAFSIKWLSNRDLSLSYDGYEYRFGKQL